MGVVENICKCKDTADWIVGKEIASHMRLGDSHREPLNIKPDTNSVGSNHYKHLTFMQPAEFCEKNHIDHLESCIIKRACRHSGIKDLHKIIDEAIKIMDYKYEYKYNHNKLDEVINGK